MSVYTKLGSTNLRKLAAELKVLLQRKPVVDTHLANTGNPHDVMHSQLSDNGAYTHADIDAHIDFVDIAGRSAEKIDIPVDVLLYNTADDDDPNWINDASASWYNEELNTATRGLTRSFPRLALLVLEASKLTIYDATDPALPMWMVFNTGTYYAMLAVAVTKPATAVAARNGLVYVASGATNGALSIFDFVMDITGIMINGTDRYYPRDIAGRNTAVSTVEPNYWVGYLVNRDVNDIALTIPPDTPIDPVRNMRTPTVAVATDGGVSVIHADGSVYDQTYTIASNTQALRVAFPDDGGLLWVSRDYSTDDGVYVARLKAIPASDDATYPDTHYRVNQFSGESPAAALTLPGATSQITSTINDMARLRDTVAAARVCGLSLIREDLDTPANGAVAHVTSTYNTGWMHGAIKGSWLADTTEETVGVDESTELVTNGTFDTDTTGWTAYNSAILSVDTNRLKITNGGPAYGAAYQTIPTVVGETYIATCDFDAGTNTTGYLFIGTTVYGSQLGQSIGSDKLQVTFVATSTTTYVNVRNHTNTDANYSFYDSISVKRTGNLVQNGDFTYSTAGWTAGQFAIFSVSSGVLRVTNGATDHGYATQQIQCEIGRVYVVSGSVVGSGGGAFASSLSIGSGPENGDIIANNAFTRPVTFVATVANPYITLLVGGNTSGAYKDFDNISVRLADPDRSVNNKGLEVHGQITKAPVATGAELVGYSGFATSNYLEQPYNSDLDFGTGDFHVMGWFKTPATFAGNPTLFRRTSGVGVNQYGWYCDSVGSLHFQNANNHDSGLDLTVGSWHYVAMVRRSGAIQFYVNGVESAVTITDTATKTDTAAKLYIGVAQNITNAAINWSMGLFRIGAGAPTADQIRAFYEDEKALFQPGAKCTLPGSSDTVNCLAYNRWRDTLHVGTEAGKATFEGLLNVDEDASGAVTAIDALGEYEATD